MLLIALCAIVSGADAWTHVAEYGRSKIKWFEKFLEQRHPSHVRGGFLFYDHPERDPTWRGPLRNTIETVTFRYGFGSDCPNH